jgi:hypothetical protein
MQVSLDAEYPYVRPFQSRLVQVVMLVVDGSTGRSSLDYRRRCITHTYNRVVFLAFTTNTPSLVCKADV